MYDPLIENKIPNHQPYPDSYWFHSAGQAPENKGELTRDIDVDVAIIGAGYTGLSCALHLAQDYGIKATVLEANETAWGCSGRNAGFILNSSGRMSFQTMEAKWGQKVMHQILGEMNEGVERVNGLIAQGIDCQPQTKGYIKIAHKASKFELLKEQVAVHKKLFNKDVEILTREQLHNEYMQDKNAYGAIRFADGYGMHPLKLAFGYQSLAQQAGVSIYTHSPVESIERNNNKLTIKTSEATVNAQKVVIATNGYTPKGFHHAVHQKTLPGLSQIIVTEPLSESQLEACNFYSSNVVMDTRALKYYYRKLPDNRILFGGRGAITGKGSQDPYFANRLLAVLKSSFPSLANIKIDYAWAGWICMALDDLPHVYQDEHQQVFYSMGYCGSGVSFSVQAGKRLADKIAEQSVPDIPLYNKALPTFPFAPLRRLGQWGYFQYGKFADRYL